MQVAIRESTQPSAEHNSCNPSIVYEKVTVGVRLEKITNKNLAAYFLINRRLHAVIAVVYKTD